MNSVFFACLVDELNQSIPNFTIHTFNIEVHVILMEFFEHFLFGANVSIDPEKCWNFFLFNMNQIFVLQILQ